MINRFKLCDKCIYFGWFSRIDKNDDGSIKAFVDGVTCEKKRDMLKEGCETYTPAQKRG